MSEDPRKIRIEAYNYPLPEERIAKYPLAERDQSKLLHYRQGEISEHTFKDLPQLIDGKSLLVFNDTKVIHARLRFRKATGAMIEVFCLEPYGQTHIEAFEQRERCRWKCFIGNNKKWKEEPLHIMYTVSGQEAILTAQRREGVGDAWIVDFEWTGGHSFAEVIDAAGVIPLPPYLHREAEKDDNERYQTVYAEHEGSVAAPTAGLHFTDQVFEALKQKGVETEFITLDVGAGTFKPVSSETIGEHEMHVERVHISQKNIEHILQHGTENIIAVGTTTVRTLESLYWFGIKLLTGSRQEEMEVEQWDPYTLDDNGHTAAEALQAVERWMKDKEIDLLEGTTRLLIAPGYRYHVIKKLITNFHQPQSTLLLLVSALIGEEWKRCYRYALEHGFRFLSYGDSCLFEP